MAIFVNENTKVIVQGMTGSEGTKHTKRMLKAGTKIVGGVTPGKGGQSVDMDGAVIPVFNTVKEAMQITGATASVVFVPPKFAKTAVIDAIDAQIPLVVVITEGIPVHDVAAFYTYSVSIGKTQILGPNCPGIISPGKTNLGIIPSDITGPGKIGLVSKSGTLTYQMMYELRDFGFTTAVGIGGDPIIGTTHIDCLRAFQDDPETKAIVMITKYMEDRLCFCNITQGCRCTMYIDIVNVGWLHPCFLKCYSHYIQCTQTFRVGCCDMISICSCTTSNYFRINFWRW